MDGKSPLHQSRPVFPTRHYSSKSLKIGAYTLFRELGLPTQEGEQLSVGS